MIGQVLPRGSGVRGLLYYLFTEGLAGEKGLESDHTDARVIASWDGRPDAVQPGLGPSGKRDFTELAARLNEPVAALGYSKQELRTIKPVYHLAVAAAKDPETGAPLDRTLTDSEWADIAQEYAGLGAVQRYNGVPPHTETRGYIARIRSLMASHADPAASAPGAGPPGTWTRPISGSITSHYGPRWGRLHAGVDIGAPIGTPVYAASNGTVAAAGPANDYGKWVKLSHAGGISTVYGHISSWTVTVGQAVQPGQLIAYSGNEGRSTGPHLHFEVRPGDRPVDPVAFYAAHGIDLT